MDKQSTADLAHLETKAAPVDNQAIHSPALSKTSVASSNRSAVVLSLEAKTAENITVSKDENKKATSSTSSSTSKLSVSEDENKNKVENKNEQAISTLSSMSKLRSSSKSPITHSHLPSTDQTNAEQIFKDTNSLIKDSHTNASLEASKPSLMVSSLDKQMAELQEALRAAGLPPIDGSSNSSRMNVPLISTGTDEPIVRSPAGLPEDIEQVLRELATQEVVSLSRKMLHEKETEIEDIQIASQQLQTAQNHQIKTQPGGKLSQDIHIPLSDCNIVSSSENLLAEIASFKDFGTQSEDEGATDSKPTASIAKKKNVLKTNAKRENVFQRLSAPKSTPPMKKPPAVKRAPPKSTRRSRISTGGSHKKEKQSSFDGQGTYDLKSTTEVKLDHKSVRIFMI